MTLGTLNAVAFFAFTLTFTPGPANITLMGMASRYGFQRSLPFLLGVVCGFGVLGVALALGMGQLMTHAALYFGVLKWLGAAYLIYIAFKIAGIRAIAPISAKPPRFITGLILHPLNPKAWMMLFAAYTQFVDPNKPGLPQLFTILAVFMVIGAISNTIWCYAGSKIRAYLHNARRIRVFNIIMAVALLAVVVWIMVKNS